MDWSPGPPFAGPAYSASTVLVIRLHCEVDWVSMPISGAERMQREVRGGEGNLQIGRRRESADTAGDGKARTHTRTENRVNVTHGTS
ncbi:hypothetical protein E2C01_097586 [Portunus trituberculatus]|uniref:Uncharacterized protein n=1 Tax=Portunus trituberculatus TaxID=210409 RepID=A0A5B7JZ06_PORTR|nr:hypothetical protein [Portunus trituberculatus]